MTDIGGAFVKISPDLSGFAAEVQAGIREALAGAVGETGGLINPAQISDEFSRALTTGFSDAERIITPQLDEGFQRAASGLITRTGEIITPAIEEGFAQAASGIVAPLREIVAPELEAGFTQLASGLVVPIRTAAAEIDTTMAEVEGRIVGDMSAALTRSEAEAASAVAEINALLGEIGAIESSDELTNTMLGIREQIAGQQELAAAIEEAKAASAEYGATFVSQFAEARQAAVDFAAAGIGAVDAALAESAAQARATGAAMDEAFGGLGGGAGRIGSAFESAFAGIGRAAEGVAPIIEGSIGGAFTRVAELGTSALEGTFNAVKGAATGLSIVLTAGVVGALVEGVKQATNFAKLQSVFTAITHNASESQQMIQSIRETAIETGQSFDTMGQLSQRLLAAGVQNVPQVINAMATYATAFGRNTQSMSRATVQLEEVQFKGTIQAQQLNALIRDGVPGYQALTVAAENLGLAQKGSATATADAIDAMKAGKISAQDFFKALSDPQAIGQAEAAVQALQGNIGFQMQKLQTEVQHTLGQLFTPLQQTLGFVVQPISDAMAAITLNSKGLAAAGNLIRDAFGATLGPAVKAVADGLKEVNNDLNDLANGTSVQTIEARFQAIAPLLTTIGGAIASIGLEGLATFIPFVPAINPIVGAMLALALSSKDVRDDLAALAMDAVKAAGIVGQFLTPAIDGIHDALDRAGKAAKPFIDLIGPTLDGLSKDLQSGDLQSAINNIGGIAGEIVLAVQHALSAAFGQINWADVGRELGKGVGTLAQVMASVINTAIGEIDWTGLGRAAGKGGPAFAAGFAEAFFPALWQIMTSDQGFGGLLNNIGLALGGGSFAQGTSAAISSALEEMVGTAVNNMNLAPWVRPFFNNISNTLGNFGDWANSGADPGQLASAFEQWIGSAWNAVIAWAGSGIDVNSLIQPIVAGITNWFQTLPDGIGQIMSEFWSVVVGWFQSLFDTLVGHSIVPDMINAIVAAFLSLPGRIVGAIAGMVGGVIGWFASMAGQAIGWVAAMSGSVVGQTAGMVGGVLGEFGAMVGGAIGSVGQMSASVLATTAQMAGGAWSAVSSFGSNVGSGIASGVGFAVGAASSLVQSAVSAAAGAVGGTFQIGYNIASGIAGGISSGIGDIVSAAVGAVNSAVNAAKAAAGISSPSKVARDQLGVPLSQGIAVGLEAGIPAVTASARRVIASAANLPINGAGAAVAASGGSGGAVTRQGDTYNLIGPDPATLLQQLRAQQAWQMRAVGAA